jgi:hypothetical protein
MGLILYFICDCICDFFVRLRKFDFTSNCKRILIRDFPGLSLVGCDPEPDRRPDPLPKDAHTGGLMYDMQPEFSSDRIPPKFHYKHTMTNLSDRPHDEKQRGDIVYRFKKRGAVQPTERLKFSLTELPLPPAREVGSETKTPRGLTLRRPKT